MLPKQKIYNVGIYLRLSKDDERAGESLSIENQRKILTSYVKEQQGWTIYDTYIDDGISGTSFDRPGVQRMLDDAKNGKINLIICKDLSRFGRNYIQVGQYTDYIFPMYNIRFIALNDNIDTANSDSTSMDMMPIMNIFNEWHSANTSKKLKAVFNTNAKAGKYKCTYCPYGYFKGDDENRTPVIDTYAAPIVKRIFEMRASGYNPKKIAGILNAEKILTPFDYYYQRIGKPNPNQNIHLWSSRSVRNILDNPIYLGKLSQLKTTTVSYKNHKTIYKDETEWVVIENNHEPIISQELWDKCVEIKNSVSHGKSNKNGVISALSGLMYCDGCGNKMRHHGSEKYGAAGYTCGLHSRFGSDMCSTHYIRQKIIEEIVLSDIRSKIQFVLDEENAREIFLARKSGMHSVQTAGDKKRKQAIKNRLGELDNLIQNVYEDKVIGKVPEEVCINLLEKYQQEKNNLQAEYTAYEKRSEMKQKDEKDVDEFIRRLKKYAGAEILTREMCLELIEYITIDENNKGDRERPRKIHIYYKLLDKSLANKRNIYKQ